MATIPSIPSISGLLTKIQLPGSLIDSATKAANAATAATEAAVPSFDSLMSAAKTSLTDGAKGLFKDVSATINSVGAAQFGIGSENSNIAGFEAYKTQISDVQKNAMIDMAIAKAALAQKVREATAAGQSIGNTAINAALDATKSLQNLQANLTNPAQLAADAASAAAAKAEAITSLKANVMLAMLSKPLPPTLAGAVSSNMNPSLVNNLTKLNVIKAQETSATQVVPSERTPTDTVRPVDRSVRAALDDPPAPPIAPPPVDRRVYKSEVTSYETKKDTSKTAYLAHIGLTWATGQPDYTKAERNAALLSKLNELYDTDVGRSGANADRIASSAIAKAKSKEERTPAEQALIDQVLKDRDKFYAGAWWVSQLSLYNTYNTYYENYKIVYDCWINNGDRFALPAALEKELKSG
jgi:hypothetical protein